GAAANGFFGGGLDRINIGLGGRDLLVAGIGTVEVRDELSGVLLAGPVSLPAGFSIVRSRKYFIERFSVRTIGDVNFDSLDDFAVGSPGTDQVLILDGNPATFGTTLAMINSPAAGTLFGYSIAPMGDLNSDGAAEFLIGAPRDSLNQGMVYLYDGATFTVIAQVAGNGANEFFGFEMDGNFDLNADGITDAIIGAPGDTATATAGYAQTLSGITLAPLYGATTTPAAPPGLAGPVYGTNVAGLGDLNGDGFPEYAVGLPQDTAAVGGTGHNFVYLGGPLASITPIGNGCSSDGTPPPILALGGSAALGGTLSPAVIDPFHPGTTGAWFLGTPGATPPCFDLTGAVTLSGFTLVGGVAFPPPIPVPVSPALLGARFRFQAAVVVPGGFNVSNSFEVVVGLQ
ncbi:MAG: integrin alpha, partial [Acidobacteriota bacterium]